MSREEKDTDVLSLAMKAKAKGYDTPEKIVPRIEAMIRRQHDYVDRREQRGIVKPIDKVIKEDNEVLVMVIVLLESH